MRVTAKTVPARKNIPTPQQIFDHLNEYIVGQEDAKRSIAIAAYNHVKRCTLPPSSRKLLRKSNVLMMGPTGCGKTYLARKLADFLELPFCSTDATDYTQAGYHGKDVEAMVSELFVRAHHSAEDAQRGIIFIDEIDKIATRTHHGSSFGFRDIGGEGVQQALLKVIEGRELFIPIHPGHPGSKQETVFLDTSDILFLGAGTFDGLDRSKKTPISGFIRQSKEISAPSIDNKDFVEYGFIPEFVGRFPLKVQLSALLEDEMLQILSETPESLVKEYKYLLELDGVQLRFEPCGLQEIARHAVDKKIGARGLRTLMETVCKDIMFQGPILRGETVFIDQAYVAARIHV